MQPLKIIAISDTHRNLTEEQHEILAKHTPEVDIVITLGDTPLEYIRSRVDYGVLGNHDSWYGIEPEKNLHLKSVNVKGYTLAGLQGSIRYKDGNHIMYTQEEAKQLQIPRADILISHDSCYLNPEDDVHCGLEVLSEYIEKYKPLVHFHGHHHENKVYRIGNTLCVSVYKCVLATISCNHIFTETLF